MISTASFAIVTLDIEACSRITFIRRRRSNTVILPKILSTCYHENYTQQQHNFEFKSLNHDNFFGKMWWKFYLAPVSVLNVAVSLLRWPFLSSILKKFLYLELLSFMFFPNNVSVDCIAKMITLTTENEKKLIASCCFCFEILTVCLLLQF